MTKDKYIPLLFDYLPTTQELNSHFDLLFNIIGLKNNRRSKASKKTVTVREHALRLICCSLLKRTNFVERRCCALSIDPHHFTGVGFSRETFDAVVNRLEMNGYIRFERGIRTPQKRLLSRLYTTRKLIKFFEEAGFSDQNISGHIEKHFPKEPIGSRLVEAKTNSSWIYGHKEKGKRIDPRYLRANSQFIGQVQLMTELNTFLFTARIELPNGQSFTGLKRVFNKYSGPDYLFDMGGRLYAQDQGNYQQLQKRLREKICINGEPVVEIDIHASFLTIAHSFFGLRLPETKDLYKTTGFHREIAKHWINLSLTKSMPLTRWPPRTCSKLRGISSPLKPAGYFGSKVLEVYPFIDRLSSVNHCWGRLQYIESDIIVGTLKELQNQGVAALPVHDSIIVPFNSKEAGFKALSSKFYENTGIWPMLRH